MMNCKEATKLLSDKKERHLLGKEQVSLTFHTMMCSACRNFGKQMDSISVFSQSYLKVKDKEDSE
tara:strand:+ start:140 stop:334 length:195 start_codon:yes stop_codon:yes gene_type:complete